MNTYSVLLVRPGARSRETRPISIQGPVELVDGKLMVRIPLNAGGRQLAPVARGVGSVVGDHLEVVIQPWLANTLRIGAGSVVFVDNSHGQLTISRSGAYTAEEAVV